MESRGGNSRWRQEWGRPWERGVVGRWHPAEAFESWMEMSNIPVKRRSEKPPLCFSPLVVKPRLGEPPGYRPFGGKDPQKGLCRAKAASGAGCLLCQPLRPAAKKARQILIARHIWKQLGDRKLLISSYFSMVRRWIGIKVTAMCILSVRAAK